MVFKLFYFTVENAIDKFLEADGNNFVLVRDAAKKFMIENAAEIVETEAFERLHESLICCGKSEQQEAKAGQ